MNGQRVGGWRGVDWSRYLTSCVYMHTLTYADMHTQKCSRKQVQVHGIPVVMIVFLAKYSVEPLINAQSCFSTAHRFKTDDPTKTTNRPTFPIERNEFKNKPSRNSRPAWNDAIDPHLTLRQNTSHLPVPGGIMMRFSQALAISLMRNWYLWQELIIKLPARQDASCDANGSLCAETESGLTTGSHQILQSNDLRRKRCANWAIPEKGV